MLRELGLAMKDHAIMSPELIGILAVGAVIAGMILTGFLWTNDRLDTRIEGLDSRLCAVEQNVVILMERTKHLDPVKAHAQP